MDVMNKWKKWIKVCAGKCVLIQYSDMFVVTIDHYLDDYLWSVIPNDELEIYNIVSYFSISVFCCSTAISASANVFDSKLVSFSANVKSSCLRHTYTCSRPIN